MSASKPDNQRYEQQRLEAIRAAAAVFAEKGYHGASTKDIAAVLGIKQGSLYYYFKSKEEALHEVCLYGIQEYVARMDAIADKDHGFQAKLMAVVTAHLSSYREKNEALKVHNDERLYLPKEKRTQLKNLGSHYRERLEEIFEVAKKKGDISQEIDCHFAAQAVIGLCNAFGELIVRDAKLKPFDLAQDATDLLLNGFSKKTSSHT